MDTAEEASGCTTTWSYHVFRVRTVKVETLSIGMLALFEYCW